MNLLSDGEITAMSEFFGMDVSVSQLVFIYVFAFMAGFIDSIAGGGGLIQLPALFAAFPGAPAVFLLGTNKLSSSCGTALATVRFSRQLDMNWRRVLPLALTAGCLSVLGALTALNVPNAWLRPLVIVLLVLVLIYTRLNRTLGETPQAVRWSGKRQFFLGLGAVAAIGLYDGFFGPGTGNFLILALISVYGFDFIHASASTKVINLGTNIGALILFFNAGTIYVHIGLTMALFNMAGAYLGVKLAILKGSKFIRMLFLLVVAALLMKQLYDLINSFLYV